MRIPYSFANINIPQFIGVKVKQIGMHMRNIIGLFLIQDSKYCQNVYTLHSLGGI